MLDHMLEVLRQGFFAKPGPHQEVLRLTTISGDILLDRSPHRVMAIKVVVVEGSRLPGSETATTQDLVLVNLPAFSAPNAKQILRQLQELAKTTGKVEGIRMMTLAISRTMRKSLLQPPPFRRGKEQKRPHDRSKI